jgi:two-component system, NarL family, response regulator DevR
MAPSQRRPAAFAGTSVGAAAGRCSGRGPRQDHDAAHSASPRRRPAVIGVLVVAPTGACADSLAPLLAADAQLDVATAVADLASAVCSAMEVHPDAVVDDSIGDGDIAATIHALREAAPRAALVVLARAADLVAPARAVAAGAVGYVLREDRPEVLLAAVRAASRGGISLSPHVAADLLRDQRQRRRRPAASDDGD